MNESVEEIERQPSCVTEMLNRLSEVADAFQAGKPLGPYLIDTLLEHVELCPALEQAEDDGAHARLEQALEKTRHSVRVAVACPSVKRDWAAQELRTAVKKAQECLDQWRESIRAESGKSDQNALLTDLKRIDSPRCRNCVFTEPELRG